MESRECQENMSSWASLRKMTLCGVGEGGRDARPRQRKVVNQKTRGRFWSAGARDRVT